MTVYISIVSHGHKEIIEKINCLPSLAKGGAMKVFLLDNIGETGLRVYCEENNISYLKNNSKKGFGENNNIIFSHIEKVIGFKSDDYFLVLNPDVKVDLLSIMKIYEFSEKNKNQLTTINLYKDTQFKVFDCCVRMFPSFIDFLSSYLGLGNKTIIDKAQINKPIKVDWAAGSFLLFKSSLYNKLGGFDSNYFMYCEDIDICWRSKNIYQEELIFSPDIKAVHYAQHANRSILSKHFFWHLKSMFRFLMMYYGIRKPLPKKENKICTKE